MADGNQTLTNLLASLLGGLAGGVAGAVVAARINRQVPAIVTRAQLVPVEGRGHFYSGPSRKYFWVDDLCLFHLFPSAREVSEVAGGYVFTFPDNESAWFRLCSLVAPGQIGRLFEVRGETSVRAVLERCAILAKSGEADDTAVRMVGVTMKEYEQQIDAELRGGRDAVR